jgi:hypothetical protein
LGRNLAKQRLLLRTAHRDRRTRGNKFAKTLELSAAKLAPGDKACITAPVPQCWGIDRQGVLAGTHYDGALIGHHHSVFAPRRGLVITLSTS